jgi:hypothetical protein
MRKGRTSLLSVDHGGVGQRRILFIIDVLLGGGVIPTSRENEQQDKS